MKSTFIFPFLFLFGTFIFGQTPNEIIKEFRFQKAKELLQKKPNMKKKELADAVGIYNATYFFENLKNRFEITDSDAS